MLNHITLGIEKPDRHPKGIVSGKDELKGPNILYQSLQDYMTISYDTICANCAALIYESKDLNIILNKILTALRFEWEGDKLFTSSDLLAIFSEITVIAG